jgi:hypothetical protein
MSGYPSRTLAALGQQHTCEVGRLLFRQSYLSENVAVASAIRRVN